MLNIGIPYDALDPEIRELAEDHNKDPEAILAIFQVLQDRHGGLTESMIEDVARVLGIDSARAYGVASFFTMLSTKIKPRNVLRVCDSPPCWLRGAKEVLAAAEVELGEEWVVERNSCLGLCDIAPAALVNLHQFGPLTVNNLAALQPDTQGEIPKYPDPLEGEVRVMLKHAGKLKPDSLESALEFEAYQGLTKALELPAGQVVEEMIASGVRGRGGAGFPTGQKWHYVAIQDRKPKYIVCNADESEPLVFKDRVLIDTNPHQILEGMAIAGYAVGAAEGYIYIRGEYESQALLLERAIQQAENKGLLGERIMDSEFNFKVHVHRGAGAYICGEESALLESLEGKRGEPRVRPPFPTTYGYRGMPTVVNNVETFAIVPHVLRNGAEWYKDLGDPDSPGTRMYTLMGHVNRIGLFEAPYGLTLRQIIDEFGGGMRAGGEFQFALTGGAAGTVVSAELLDVPINHNSAAKGISLGAGAFMICDQTVSPAALLRELLHFFEVESCGKCTPCRIGTHQGRILLDRHIAGKGRTELMAALAELAEVLEQDSLCGLGQSVALPVKSALKHFPNEFIVERGQA